jgi:hypothetical protein
MKLDWKIKAAPTRILQRSSELMIRPKVEPLSLQPQEASDLP